jgi:glycosyltransferase involved in cell wall biosynthesis
MMATNSNHNLTVLVIVNRLFEWSQNFITRELVELQRQGVELYVAARQIIERDDLTAEEQTLLKNFVLIPENPFAASSFWKHLRFAFKHFLRYLRAWGHFFSFGHKRPSKIFRSLVCLFRAAALADVVLKRNVNLIHAQFMTAPTETALYLSAMTGIPFGCTSHAMDIYQDNSGMSKKLARIAYMITETHANVNYFKASWRVGTNKIHQIYNSIDLNSNPLPVRQPHDPFTFLAVGRLVPKKGFKYLIRACEILKRQGTTFRCKIVGKGPLEVTLMAMAKSLDVTAVVQFVGYVPPNNMAAIYQEVDVLVMPSIIEANGDRDGLPTVCIEALSHGVPLICTDVSGLPEAVVENKNGKIVPEKNAEALAAAMIEVMKGTYTAMSENSFRIARERFDCKKNVARIREIMICHAREGGHPVPP